MDSDSTLNQSPSIFELTASDQLRGGLREASRYLLNTLKQYKTFQRIPPVDETVLAIDMLIEYVHLRAYNASYAENLYNLIRYSRNNKEKITSIWPSIVGLTLVPYMRRKIDNYFEELNYKPTRTADEVRRLRLYRLLTSSASFIDLICMLRFAVGQSNYHNITNCITGINLNCKTMIAQDMLVEDGNGLNFSKVTADLLARVLTVGSYVIQFLDFWNTHSNSTPLFSASLPIPKPPKKFLQLDDGDDDDDNDPKQPNSSTAKPIDSIPYTDERSSSICLICEHVRQNECALSNTGYVFCYSCIYKYVKTKHRCPITGNPATLDNIVRLYQDNNNQ